MIEDFIKDAYKNRYGQEIPEKRETVIFSITVAMFAIGGMIGGFGGGFVANRYGRKRGLLVNNLMGVVGAVFMACSKSALSYEMLIFGRLIIGLNCGQPSLSLSLVLFSAQLGPILLRIFC